MPTNRDVDATNPDDVEAFLASGDGVVTVGLPLAMAKVIRGLQAQVASAKKILVDGLRYHEYDGHDMPKRVSREALEALGVKRDDQP